ncbi:MAG TPA: adenylate/guanylate cyclase domain-containing protein [Nitrososphaeraceae archaeon]|nr:adenylate/guanylate cyclase domain-containing protein [Nitrososphaeraceae archaeon]
MKSDGSNRHHMAEDRDRSNGSIYYHHQTVLNLYNSGIPSDIIALQMDISQEQVDKIIEHINKEEEKKKISVKQALDTPSMGSFYLDAVFDLESAIKDTQSRVWKALKVEPDFNVSTEEAQKVLEKFAKSKVTLVILDIALVDSTRLSMTLPVERFAAIIQAFTQEMSLMVTAYGGYILKYVGNAILSFFPDDKSADLHLSCINAVNCAQSMIKIMQQGINPILNQYDYPEMSVRIGIDVGENAVVQYGWTTDIYKLDNQKQVLKKTPRLDILGYTISIAAKMSALAKPNRIVIGQSVYEILDDKQKYGFEALSIRSDVWSYVSSNTGGAYRIYENINE